MFKILATTLTLSSCFFNGVNGQTSNFQVNTTLISNNVNVPINIGNVKMTKHSLIISAGLWQKFVDWCWTDLKNCEKILSGALHLVGQGFKKYIKWVQKQKPPTTAEIQKLVDQAKAAGGYLKK